jgi:Fe-S cluster biosynthesis and repair protein YggX
VHCVYLTLSKIEGGTPIGRELKKKLFNEVNKRCFIQLTLKVTFLVEANLIKNCSL